MNNKKSVSKKNKKTLNVFETFAGIGAQRRALENVKNKNPNFEYKIVATSEWDMYANISYDLIHHNTSRDRERERETSWSRNW
ncbi:CPG DNA METHYLASE (CYTOSINE-SPECIFIC METHYLTRANSFERASE SSSI) [Mycoplasmopsis pulmonis]|uniref:CPG DNA METHYLASE (CYTOSINE-SPECIFIC METHYLTRANSFERASE SSSI) n=1 Tax=Mycoplasmopsis pulmonis (strain UAB CTIP) TaxID=272635 RepID=Q98R25_MYCPU|nr:DNA cytosine methyltransferase [Mycoplasmopsis pulmonis]MDZ7293152.1 DNA cytosine methyltransferase [Mycoplasmopsis pulmonis]CAC13358.1 CPG DNA METHYLASE (CYTOSINE-SPECIFIC METHYLTRANSFERASE SSSI) [Mycoplasmopsis pulmonis]